MVTTGRTATQDGLAISETSSAYRSAPPSAQHGKVAELVLQVVEQEAVKLASSQALRHAEMQARVVQRVQQLVRESSPLQRSLPELDAETPLQDDEVARIVQNVTEALIELTLDIPRIVVLPTREVNYGFSDFDLQHVEIIKFEPVSQEMLLKRLDDTGQNSSIHWAGQVLAHLRSYLSNPDDVENVLIYWQKQLGEFVWSQMQAHQWTTPTDYVGKVVQGFEVLKPAAFTLAAHEQPRDFRSPVADKRNIRQMVFKGFAKCCYPYQKFDSVEGKWRLAQLLEDDAEVMKWMKPATGQFRIEYLNGHHYEPDFVVECRNEYLLIEPKRADQVHSDEVQLKARAAVRWCNYANEHAKINQHKP